jgi:tetratricopeptide (TPR) repeat protein
MNETTSIETTSAGSLVEGRGLRLASGKVRPHPSVRASPGAYLAALFTFTFASLLFLHGMYDLAALFSFSLGWVVIPLLAFTDRIKFDGRVIKRIGPVRFLLRLLRAKPYELAVEDVERIETYALRTLKHSGRVRYRYRSEVTGKGISFVFASGGDSYREMVQSLFRRVADDKLDARSRELRDHLTDPKTLRDTLGLLHLAPSNILEEAATDLRHRATRNLKRQTLFNEEELTAIELERGRLLRRAANQLRAAGRLREAAEAFRRALLVSPRDGWLIYEFARFLRSQASSLSDARLLNRARAALRLAARRACDDAVLLSRIGESHFELGDAESASRNFRRALKLNPQIFRAECGLAESALLNGKLAHVVHHYESATRIARDAALARYAQREADYYLRLNSDEDYLAVELRRIGWLHHIQRARRIAVRLTIAAFLLALLGGTVDEDLSKIGWALASSSIIAWMSVRLASRFFTQRREW